MKQFKFQIGAFGTKIDKNSIGFDTKSNKKIGNGIKIDGFKNFEILNKNPVPHDVSVPIVTLKLRPFASGG